MLRKTSPHLLSLLTAAALAGPAVAGVGGPDVECITFEGFPAGTIPDFVSSDGGFGPISVFGRSPAFVGQNAAVIFDSANPTGDDPDLGTPNETFGGPGIGVAGEMGSPFENAVPYGNILILGEDLTDADDDGLVDDPDDADLAGATLTFTFPSPVQIVGLTIIDVEEDEQNATFEAFDVSNQSIFLDVIPQPGDNGVINATESISGVTRAVVTLNGSGGFDNLCFIPQEDCNENGVPDDVDIDTGASQDCNDNGTPDECEPDCNGNGIPDDCDLLAGGEDCNENGILDECEDLEDCDANGVPDVCELADNDCNENGILDACEDFEDCNENGIPDECELDDNDCNDNGIPDECEPDCNDNGVPDECDVLDGTSTDFNGNGTPDECEDCVEDDLTVSGVWKLDNGTRRPELGVAFFGLAAGGGNLELDFEHPESCVRMITDGAGNVCIAGEAWALDGTGLYYLELCYTGVGPKADAGCGKTGITLGGGFGGVMGQEVGFVESLGTGQSATLFAKSTRPGLFFEVAAYTEIGCEYEGSGWLSGELGGLAGDLFFGIVCEDDIVE